MWTVADREFEAVSSLPGRRRYEYLIKRVADRRELWSLKGDDGWVLAAGPDGQEQHPVWPHPRFAEACQSGTWATARPAPIDVHRFLARWAQGTKGAGRAIAAFPTPNLDGVRVEVDDFVRDLRLELALME